jgi:Chaperone of endosialidase
MTQGKRLLLHVPIGALLLGSSAVGQELASDAVQKEAEGLGLNGLGDSQADLVYTPVTPCRIIDTRLAGGKIAAGTTRSFKVTGDTTAQGGANCGIPFGSATSAMINFVAVGATAPGDLRVTPSGATMPTASILNWAGGVSGLNLANGLAVALCNPAQTTCTSDITLQADASAIHVVADVQGYYRKTPALSVNTSLSNTALGDSALASNTTGTENTATGRSALQQSTTAADNSAFGYAALAATTTGGSNSAFGAKALSANTTGGGNSAFGYSALGSNQTGAVNAAFGSLALGANTTGFANSAFGSQALRSNTTGQYNSAFGLQALWANTTGIGNSAFGEEALTANTTGAGNSAFGAMALYNATTGDSNSAFGDAALFANTTGAGNSAFGEAALYANQTGQANAAFGYYALRKTTASGSSAFGYQALYSNTTGGLNAAFGYNALYANTTGGDNSAFGYLALQANTQGQQNSAFGRAALFANTTGSFNSAFGIESLSSNTLGTFNAAFGHRALRSSTGSYNAAFGQLALWQMSSGDNNIAVGYSAGFSLTSGSYNVYVGNNGMSESNTIRIGTAGTHTATYIAGISGTTLTGSAVYVNSNGQLGVATSSSRYKEQIADMSAESDVLLKLRPVSFYYRPDLDETHLRQYGLVAEEVAEVAPGLVAYDADGTPQTVRYHFVNAMLLNEVQKQRRQLDNQNAEIRELRKQLARLEARLAQ